MEFQNIYGLKKHQFFLILLVLQFPVNEGIEELIEAIDATLNEKNCSHLDLCTGEIHKAIHSINPP